MRKKIMIISSLLLVLLLGLTAYWIFFRETKGAAWTSEWSFDITLSDGKAEPQMSHGNFTIAEDGSYILSLKYLPKGSSIKSLFDHPETAPAFLAGCVITDEQGRLQYAISGDFFTVDTSMELTAGTYNLDYYYLTNREDYIEFAKTYLCGSAMAENYADGIDFPSPSEVAEESSKQETWSMEYAIGVSRSGAQNIQNIAILFGLLIGFCLLVLIFSLSLKGPEWKERYDERQELERGRGFKYAFFTMLIYFFAMFILDTTVIPLAVDTSVLYCSGILLGILVYMVYCIWHESYFALNQNMRSTMTALVLIGLFNFVIGLSHLIDGLMIENGRLTFHVVNFLCAFLFFVLFLTMLLKRIVSTKVNSADDEDDKEEQSA